MRDKNRIKPLLNRIEEYWNMHSDLRFGQLIYILCENLDCRKGTDIFFPEDDKWLESVEKAINKAKESREKALEETNNIKQNNNI